MSLPDIITEIREFAIVAHQGQHRDFSGQPYVMHPLRVSSMLYELGYSTNIVLAAMLHDVLEDTNVTEAEMRAIAGDGVTDLVMYVTEPEKLREQRSLTKTQRKAEFLEQLSQAPVEAQAIKLADIIDNTRDMAMYVPHNPDRAERFLFAKVNMLKILTKGNIDLRIMAEKELDNLSQSLSDWYNQNEKG